MKTEKERIYNALNVIKIFLSSVRFSQSIGKWNQSEFLKLAWLILARDNNMLNSCKCRNRMCYVFLFRNCTQLKFDRFFFDNRIKYSSSLNFNFNFFSCNDETFIKNSLKKTAIIMNIKGEQKKILTGSSHHVSDQRIAGFWAIRRSGVPVSDGCRQHYQNIDFEPTVDSTGFDFTLMYK